MNLISTYTKITGQTPKKESTTSFAGPCPACGGTDRLVLRPAEQRWFCRQCSPRGGDTETFLMRFCGMTFKEACQHTGRQTKSLKSNPRKPESKWTPKETFFPAETWIRRADEYVEAAKEQLWAAPGTAALDHLRGRGLKDATIKKAGLGFVPRDIWEPSELWGLERDKKIWLPKGVLIPCRADTGQVLRLRIRRDKADDEFGRYIVIPGSNMTPMVLPGNPAATIIVESELDGILIHQEAEDLITAIALGSAQARPDVRTEAIIRRADTVLYSMDFDEAGVREFKWWRKHFPKSAPWPTPGAKDPGEYHQAGGNVRAWIMAGLPSTEVTLAESEPATADVLGMPGAVYEHLRDILPDDLMEHLDWSAEFWPDAELLGFRKEDV
jgi:DNA primase